MNNKVRLIIGVMVIIILLGAASIVYTKFKAQALAQQTKETTTQSDGANTKDEKQMVPDFKLKDLKGNDVKLSSYRGKIVILNFWAVWCKYCKQEMPDLNELNKTLVKDNKVVLLAVDSEENTDTVNSYLKENKISMNILLDSDGSITRKYGITGFPTTFIINRDGSLYTYIPGATNKETLISIIDKIK